MLDRDVVAEKRSGGLGVGGWRLEAALEKVRSDPLKFKPSSCCKTERLNNFFFYRRSHPSWWLKFGFDLIGRLLSFDPLIRNSQLR